MKSIWQLIGLQQRFDRFHFWLGVLVALLPAAAGVLLLGVSGWFITAAAMAGLSGAFLNIFAPSAIIRALAIIRTAGRYGERLLTHDATFRFLSDLRNRLFAQYAEEAADGRRSGLALNRLTADISALDKVYLRLVVPVVLCGVVALSLLLVWANVTVSVFVVGLAFLMLWAALARRTATRADKKTARRADAAADALRLRAADLASGRRDLAVYGGLDLAAEGVRSAGSRLRNAEKLLEQRSIRLTGLSTIIGQTFLAAILLVCAVAAANGTLGLPYAVGLVLVVMALPELFSMVLPGLATIPRIASAAKRVLSTNEKNETADADTEVPGLPVEGAVPGPVLRFENTSFAYPGAAQAVFSDLSFEIARGEIVAIAGRSGCGKSTVAALAARLRVADRGTVRLNGADILHTKEEDLRRSVTVLSQRPYLFNDTVAANLRIANPEASDAALWEALEQSALVERIAEDPDGLLSILGEGGLGLSGGEQRRLALARAFLTKPALFVLDEMTEGLDEQTSADVLDRFLEFRAGAAVLMIAHKPQELRISDRIIELRATPST